MKSEYWTRKVTICTVKSTIQALMLQIKSKLELFLLNTIRKATNLITLRRTIILKCNKCIGISLSHTGELEDTHVLWSNAAHTNTTTHLLYKRTVTLDEEQQWVECGWKALIFHRLWIIKGCMQAKRSRLHPCGLTESNSISARCPTSVFMFCTAACKCKDRKEAAWGHFAQLWKGTDTRAQDLSHISPVMSMSLLVGLCQWLHVQARLSLQTTSVAVWWHF